MRVAIVDDIASERTTLRNQLEMLFSSHSLYGTLLEYERWKFY